LQHYARLAGRPSERVVGAAATPTRRFADANSHVVSRNRARPRGDPPRIFRAVRHRPGAGRLPGQGARRRPARGAALGFYAKPKLLIVDELGYLPFEPNAAHLFFQLVSRRYERGSMLINSNRSVGEWGAVFGDPVVATAILDRLLDHSQVVTIRGDSYRLGEKRRAGLVSAVPIGQGERQ
jgi:hypothetical protein